MSKRWFLLFLPASVIACSNAEDAKQFQIGPPETVAAGQDLSESKPAAIIDVIDPPLNGKEFKPGERVVCKIAVRAQEGGRLPEAITVYIYDKNIIMGSVAAEIVKKDGNRSVEMRAVLNAPREPKQYELKAEAIYTKIIEAKSKDPEPKFLTTRKYSEPRLIKIVRDGK